MHLSDRELVIVSSSGGPSGKARGTSGFIITAGYWSWVPSAVKRVARIHFLPSCSLMVPVMAYGNAQWQ